MVGACGPRAGRADENSLEMECREGGIVEEYQLDNTVNNPERSPELFSLELLTLIKAEPRITLFQNTWFVGVVTANSNSSSTKKILSATAEDQGSQRRYIIKAKVYIDASGDGRLGAEAGAEWVQGREGQQKYNESFGNPGGPDHEVSAGWQDCGTRRGMHGSVREHAAHTLFNCSIPPPPYPTRPKAPRSTTWQAMRANL